ncbi:MAG: hypothetical protein U9N06_04545 [candidate division WOR-3 bacterium]|nr:hypothetical protein [candidate division WOR-3 bacterium]
MFYISLFLLFFSTSKSEEYYKNGLYEEALKEYTQYLKEGISNPELYLNIGNCYYRMDKFGESLLNYRRGWFLSPNDPNIRHNISLFREQKETPNPFISFTSGVIDRISLRDFSYLLIFSFAILIIIGSIRMIQSVRPIRFPTTFLFFIIGIIFIFSLSGFSIWQGRVRSNWVVFTESTIAHSGPGDQFKDLMTVDEAEEGSLIREDGGWWLIQLHSGEGGWVDSSSVSLVLKGTEGLRGY